MGRSTETLRFAFGSPEEPASSVWRINSRNKTGDVYIHNAPQFGSSIHIALHASGRFSLKLASERFKLEPPFEYQRGFYWGPIFFFRKFRSKLPSIPPSGNQDLINWLGLPAKTIFSRLQSYMLRLGLNSNHIRSNEESDVYCR
jgi:hypothetical protein